MRTVYHPTLHDVSRDVPDGDVESWRDAGWRLTKPRPSTAPAPKSEPDEPVEPVEPVEDPESPAAATAADQGQHSDKGEH